MKTELYRSKKLFPGKAISIGRLNNGYWFVDSANIIPLEMNLFISLEQIEEYLDDELELIVPVQ